MLLQTVLSWGQFLVTHMSLSLVIRTEFTGLIL
jgi:hypothetical protein